MDVDCLQQWPQGPNVATASTTITATFDIAGRLSGAVSGNRYQTSFTETDRRLTINGAASTRWLYQPAAIMSQEQAALTCCKRWLAMTSQAIRALGDTDDTTLAQFIAPSADSAE